MAAPTVPDEPRTAEDVAASLSGVKQFRLQFGTTLPEFVVEAIDDEVRPELVTAAEFLDCEEYRDLHLRLLNFVDSLDDFRALLKERGGS